MRREEGFTFVEAMVVLALFAIVGVSLFSSMSMGLSVWKRASSPDFAHRKSLLALERLSTDLRRTSVLPVLYFGDHFLGEKTNVTFENVVDDKILQISYIFAAEDKSLSRNTLSLQQQRGLESAGKARKLVPDVKDFALSYWGYDSGTKEYAFFDTWNSTKTGYPYAVRVTLTLENGEVFEKTVIIPIAQ